MRFTCEACGKRYLTRDVLEPGRVYRTRCKACGNAITVRGGEEPATGEVPAPARPTPPVPPAARAPARPTPPPVPPLAAAVRAAPPEPRYVDLFDGELDEAAPPPAPARLPAASSPPRRAPVPPAARPAPEPDPFAVALASAVHVRAGSPPSGPEAPSRALLPVRPRPPARAQGRAPMVAGLAVAGAVVALLTAGAVWRPWRTATSALPAAVAAPAPEAPPSAAPPATTPAAPTAPPPPAGPAEAVPAAPPAPADDTVLQALAREQEEEVRRLEAERQEQERARTERLEQARLAREAKADRVREEQAERARLAREEKAERARLAREEKERARAEKLGRARLARLEPAALATRSARLEGAPPPAAPEPRGLAPEAIQNALAAGRKAFDACFRDQARGIVPPIAASQVTVRFLVQPGGTVTSPEVADGEVADSAAGQCLRSAAAGLQFPAFKGEPARVDAPVDVPPAPPGGRLVAVEFTGPHSARGGGDVGDTVYSERPNDAAITERTFADGVLTYAGQVGLGEGSKYAGIGMNVNMFPGSPARAIDASRFKAMSIRLAARGTRSLRVRIIGAEETTRNNGCYPVTNLRVTPELKEYVLRFSDFDPEGWCGGKGRSVSKTLKELQGFEIADANMDREPVTFSTGTIVLLP